MEKKEIEQFHRKHVKIVLNSGIVYEGKIIVLNASSLIMNDKYGIPVKVSIKNIAAVEDKSQIVENYKRN